MEGKPIGIDQWAEETGIGPQSRVVLDALKRIETHLGYFVGRDMTCLPACHVYRPVEDDLRLALEAMRPIRERYWPQ